MDLHSKKTEANIHPIFFTKEPDEICSKILVKKGRKAGFSCAQKARKSQCSKGKVKDKQKERGRRKEAQKRKENPWLVYTV